MMKKHAKIRFLAYIVAAVGILSLSGCDFMTDTIDEITGKSSGDDDRTFYAANLVTNTYDKVTAEKRYTGSSCIVYVEKSYSSKLKDDVIQGIATDFDNKVYAMVHSYFADTSTAEDVDGNKKVILLLLDIKDGYVEGSASGYVAGFFDSSNMLAGTTSNKADMLFMDIYPGLLNSSGTVNSDSYADFKVTMAHEFQHLVDYSEKVLTQKVGSFDTWIDEGLSSAAEYLYQGSHIGWKVDYFNYQKYITSRSGTYSPSADYNLWGQYFISWNSDSYGNDLINYSTVYLFFQWLRIHSDTSIYKTILTDASATSTAVVNAAKKISDYSAGTTLKALLLDWFAANYLNSATGRFGYKNGLTGDSGGTHLYPRYFTTLAKTDATKYFGTDSTDATTYGKIALLSGEAIYMKLASSKALSDSSPIVYEGLNVSTGSYSSGSYASNDVLVSANIGSVDGSYGVTDQLTTFDASTVVAVRTDLVDPVASLIAKSSTVSSRKRFPVDAVLGQAEDGTVKSSFSPVKASVTAGKK